MAQSMLQEGRKSSEYAISQIGIGVGVALQVMDEVTLKMHDQSLSTNEVIAMTKANVTPENVAKLTMALKEGNISSYTGVIISLIFAVVYIAKRATLKIIELRGLIAIEVEKTKLEIEKIKQQSQVSSSSVHSDSNTLDVQDIIK